MMDMMDGVRVLRRVRRWGPECRGPGWELRGSERRVVQEEAGGWVGQQGAEEASI